MKRRDITLGEMQDECRRRNAFCGDMGACPYRDFCHETVGDKCGWGDKGPRDWNLTDPPRFNEAQMALLKALLDNGIKKISRNDAITFDFTRNDVIGDGLFLGAVKLEVGETLDLAELLGKEGADEKA